MSKLIVPQGYVSVLSVYETQKAIEALKQRFQFNLAQALNLCRVSAPLFVDAASGLNDNLNGVERPVSFDVKEDGSIAEIVQSLAKWKRMALGAYGFPHGEGLYTDMNAIRRDEDMDMVINSFLPVSVSVGFLIVFHSPGVWAFLRITVFSLRIAPQTEHF